MKTSDESYTIMIFRGAMKSPRRLKLRKVTVRRVAIIGTCVILSQMAILAHYFVQHSQLAELNGLRKEVVQSRKQTAEFSVAIDEMKQKMFVMQKLNRKLQTMFGLEADPLNGEALSSSGQGGEEFPVGDEQAVGEGENNFDFSPVQQEGRPDRSGNPDLARTVNNINQGLSWLNRQAEVDQEILAELEDMAGKRINRWASIPSIAPVKGPVTSKFGPRVSPFTGKKTLHAGLDIGAPRGREVRAPANGKVVVAAYDTRMGNFIRIDHKYGIETTYGHLSKMLVKYGQTVQRGDVIGLVGSTGKFSTGPHLHYQVAVNDKVVDPIQYILD